MLETWQWLYIHASCKPDSLPTSINYRLNTSCLSTIKRNEHYLLLMQVLMGQYNFTHNDSHEAMLSARSYIAYWLKKPRNYIARVFCSILLLLGFAPVISNPHHRHLLSTSLLVSNDLVY